MTHGLSLSISVSLVMVAFSALAAQDISPEVARFIGEVAIGLEYDREHMVSKKWAAPATLSIFNGDREHSRIIEETVSKINRELRGTEMSLRMVEANTDADIKVYFATLEDFGKIAEREEFEIVGRNNGCFYVRWNAKYELTSAVVLLSTDQLRGAQMRHFALEEITQCLGFAGDSSRFKKSVFFENLEESPPQPGTATQFSSLDGKMMRFMYNHVEPGTHPVELGLLMADLWADAK